MSRIEQIREELAPQLARVDSVIKETLHSSNQLMNEVISSYLRHKGKQIRPILVLLTTRLFSGNIDKAVNCAASVELLHNASLIHDDIVDESVERHGNPTINSTNGSHIAVIIGDYFTSNALQMALIDGDVRVAMSLGQLGERLTLGEMSQMETALNHSLAQEDYMTVISHKTASLFVACAEMGCFACRVSEQQLNAMRTFAELFGCAFQIRDDIFDYYPNPSLGKPTGQDIQEGKLTLPLIRALSLPSPDRDQMLQLALKPEKTQEELDRLTAFTVKSGGIEYACQVMKNLRDEAFLAIKDLGNVSSLMALFDYIIDRDC